MPPRRLAGARQIDSFDPLGLENLQRVLRERLEKSSPERFPPAAFTGAGVYALYYVGGIKRYTPLVDADVPIYIGRAVAENSNYGDPAGLNTLKLFNRIEKHARSVREASETLALDDFRVRFLVIDDAWIVLAERALLRAYRPVIWNAVMSGFGGNPSGTPRRNARSIWDTVHPGRSRAGNVCNRAFTLAEMLERIDLAIMASVTEDESQRADMIQRVKSYSQPVIWKPRETRVGHEIIVLDQRRFKAEMRRMNLDLPEYRLASPVGRVNPTSRMKEWFYSKVTTMGPRKLANDLVAVVSTHVGYPPLQTLANDL
jgi:hypothetical protein